jgi:ubiquinone/menaquinone biosynthesis C-methylase UbiE
MEMGQLPDAGHDPPVHDLTMSTPTESSEPFQIPIETAEFYESAFVPAFFSQWAPVLCEAAGVRSGQRLLDVACGTGIVARTAAGLVAPDGKVVGLDLNDAMLTVARRVCPDIEFHQGNAAALPFPDGSFDVVLCQLALMFFPDRLKALAEMRRVVTAGGTVAVVVPGRLDAQAAFAPFVDMAARYVNTEAMSLLGTYFVCGDLDELAVLVESAGLRVTSARTHVGVYRAPSVDAFVTTEVESTPLIERISDEVYQRIRTGARDVLAPFTAADGAVEAPFECHVLAAQQR